ncbi:MAG: P-II family nitrogen regulator [Wenzhouxiangella sp.]
MQTHQATRIEIFIELPALKTLSRQLDRSGVTGYSVLPVLAGKGRSGSWTRDGEVSAAGGLVMVVAVVASERAESVLESVFEVLSRHIGLVSVSDCRIVRPERV